MRSALRVRRNRARRHPRGRPVRRLTRSRGDDDPGPGHPADVGCERCRSGGDRRRVRNSCTSPAPSPSARWRTATLESSSPPSRCSIWSAAVFPHRDRADGVLAVPRPTRRRHQPGLRHPSERAPTGRRLSDRGTVAGLCGLRCVRDRRTDRGTAHRRWPRRCNRGTGELALGLRRVRDARRAGCDRDLFAEEPRGGRNEMQAVLGGELVHDDRELPVSVGVAFERLRRSAASTTSSPAWPRWGSRSSASHCSSTSTSKTSSACRRRSGACSVRWSLSPASPRWPLPRRSDALFRRSPPAALVFVGSMIGTFGLFIVAGLYMPTVWLLGIFYAVGTALSAAAFISIVAVVNSVIPYRLRSRRERDGRGLHHGVRGILRCGPHRHVGRRLRAAGRADVGRPPLHARRRHAHRLRGPVRSWRHLPCVEELHRGEGRSGPGDAARTPSWPRCRSTTSTSATGRCKCCST